MSRYERRIAEALERIADALETRGDSAIGTGTEGTFRPGADAFEVRLRDEYEHHLRQRDDDD